MYKLQWTNSHTSIEFLLMGICNDARATLLSISTMAVMVAGDPTMSAVKFSVTFPSWSKNTGSELLFKDCEIVKKQEALASDAIECVKLCIH